MQKLVTLSIFFLGFLQAHTQDTKNAKRIISSTLTEKYNVLKSDKHVKEGEYEVMNSSNHTIVSGQYKDGRKDSIWIAMDQSGNIIQKYNYTDSVLLQNDVDNTTNVQSGYKLLNAGSGEANAIPPCQIGGANYGFYLLYDPKSVPAQFLTFTNAIKMTYAFTINEAGKLTECNVSYKGPGVDLTEKVDIKNKPSDLYQFIPAKVNDKPVESVLLYTVDINVNKSRLPDPYNTPTGNSKMSQGIHQ